MKRTYLASLGTIEFSWVLFSVALITEDEVEEVFSIDFFFGGTFRIPLSSFIHPVVTLLLSSASSTVFFCLSFFSSSSEFVQIKPVHGCLAAGFTAKSQAVEMNPWPSRQMTLRCCSP